MYLKKAKARAYTDYQSAIFVQATGDFKRDCATICNSAAFLQDILVFSQRLSVQSIRSDVKSLVKYYIRVQKLICS